MLATLRDDSQILAAHRLFGGRGYYSPDASSAILVGTLETEVLVFLGHESIHHAINSLIKLVKQSDSNEGLGELELAKITFDNLWKCDIWPFRPDLLDD